MSFVLSLLVFDDVTDLIHKLRSTSDVSARYQIEQQLGRAAKPGHLPILLKEIEAGPEAIRPHFVRAIRTMGGKEATQALRGIAAKYDWSCRGETAYALKILGDPAGIQYLAAEFAKPTMSGDDRLKIVQYLFSYTEGGKEAVAALRKVLESDKNEVVRMRVIDALVSHKDPEIQPVLWKIVADASDPVRFDALGALIRLGDPEAVEQSLSALERGQIPTDSLYKVLYALQSSGNATVADRLRAVLQKSEDVNLRLQLVRTLAYLKDSRSLPILHELAKDKNAALAGAALDAILELAGRSEIESLKKILKHEDADVRLRAAEALFGLDDVSGLDVVRAELSNASMTIRRRAVDALRSVRRKEAVDLLIAALDDKDASIRSTAATALTATLAALYPYLKFDLKRTGYDPTSEDSVLRGRAVEKIREWWKKNSA